MFIPKVGRRAALILGKAAGALILAAVGGTVSWLLDRERKRIQEEAVRASDEPELVIELPGNAEAEKEPEADDEA